VATRSSTQFFFGKKLFRNEFFLSNLSETFQKMEVFGVCFNELGWDALQSLKSEDVRQRALKQLFDPCACGGNGLR
jgi:hypothetical protein